MTLKPKKHSDQKKIAEKLQHRKRKVQTRQLLPPYTLIVCEGIRTEPLYLHGLADKINQQYRDISRGNHIQIYGTGRNTRNLLQFVDHMTEKGIWNHYEKIWLVYDKDDFPLDHFDNTQLSVENRKDTRISVAWSNESFELWLLLHFQEYHANNGREQYIKLLNRYISYAKNQKDLYEVVTTKGSLEDAKRRAKRMYQEFLDAGITIPSQMVPATRVYQLVEELESYLNESVNVK